MTTTSENSSATPPRQPEFSWGDPEVCQPHVASADEVTSVASGNSISVLLSGRQVTLEGSDAPMSDAYVATIRVPVSRADEKELLGYHTQVRGYASSSFGGRVVILADLGGVSHTFQHCYDETADGDFTVSFFSLAPPLTCFTSHPKWAESVPPPQLDTEVDGGPGEDKGGAKEPYSPAVEDPEPADSRLFPFTLNLAIFAVRRTDQDYARLEVDSVDVEAILR